MHLSKNKKQESGSIMLEVVAVLALMGVMGAMLFRQVYQRNQELHNIQMASEIRMVKEAFSAYIQANRAELGHTCSNNLGADGRCTISSDTLACNILGYMPDGWFGSVENNCADSTLRSAYTFYLYMYRDETDRLVLYGLVVPTIETLPESGWTFKRAARIALLVGADGGAYNREITTCEDANGCISGSLGSWHIPVGNTIVDPTAGDDSAGYYAAITGIDIFAPEYEAPEGSVNINEDWDLVLRDLHARGRFMVGNSVEGEGCYDIKHHTSRNAGENIQNDEIRSLGAGCKPLFWVENGTGGMVNIATDLNIGDIENNGGFKHNEALKLTKEGVIKQKGGLTIDKDGRIIAEKKVDSDIGDVAADEQYVLDPAYTSTMNDIRLTSRGGVRLSDILPNYILKDQKEIYCTIAAGGQSCSDNTTQVNRPQCPTSYRAALVVIPTVFGKETTAKTVALSGNTGTSNATSGSHFHALNGSGVTAKAEAKRRQFRVWVGSSTYATNKTVPIRDNPPNNHQNFSGSWEVHFGYDGAVDEAEIIRAIAQTYCVVPDTLPNNASKERTLGECEAAGFKWVPENGTIPAHCQHIYKEASVISNLPKYPAGGESDSDHAKRKAAICKAAGYTWTESGCTDD